MQLLKSARNRCASRYPVAVREMTTDGQFEVLFCHQPIIAIDLNLPPQ